MGSSWSSRATVERAPAARRHGHADYRGDIDGIRCIAVATVVSFHAGLPFVTGGFVGVDVFFVISGFLITGLLLDELRRTDTISISGFYARRVRRLLPMSALVLAVTAVAAVVVSAPSERASVAGSIRAAALYVSNLFFAQQSTDYMASDVNQSPVLHFWSLSVEEQFYLLWPVLLILVAWRVRRRGDFDGSGHGVRTIASVLALVGGASLLMSVLLTASNAPWSYFGLHTRAWELAIGAALALARPALPSLPRLGAVALGWGGLAAVLWSVVAFDRTTVYPGSAALVPVLGAAALIVSGARLSDAGAARVLSLPALRYVGRLSYSWYLWHWPFLIFATEWSARRSAPGQGAGWLVTAVAVLGSFLASMVTFRFVEQPTRRLPALVRSVPRSLWVGAGLTLTSVLLASVVSQGSSAATAGVVKLKDHTSVATQASLTSCNTHYEGALVDPDCVFGDLSSSVDVALVGDSHAAQWAEPIIAIAAQQHWRLHVWTKSSCAFEDARLSLSVFNREYTECEQWRAKVMNQIKAIPHLAAVIVIRNSDYTARLVDGDGSAAKAADVQGIWGQGADRTVTALASLTPHVIIFRETPRVGYDIPTCVSEHPHAPGACAMKRLTATYTDKTLYAGEAEVASTHPVVSFLDMTPVLCPASASRCPVVTAGGVLMYKDSHHLEDGYALTLVPALATRLVPMVAAGR